MEPAAATGAVMQIVSTAITGALLFFIIGVIEDRAHHRNIPALGGMASLMPRFSAWAAVGFSAVIGLPATSGFVALLLILLGTFSAGSQPQADSLLLHYTGAHAAVSLAWFGALATAAIVITGGCYGWTYQRVFMGVPRLEHQNFARLTRLETWTLALLGTACLLLGILPNLLLTPLRPALEGLLKILAG